jgi:protein-L-isoaspartate(D-aspartate) O-methyltransferase
MDREAELAVVRGAYAKQTMAAAQMNDARIEDAFAKVRREDFLGPGPWSVVRFGSGHTATPTNDPIYVYVDNPIGLITDRGINNGQPSLHAVLLTVARIKRGNHVVHVGAGAGYYTAIMSHLVGATGRVTAIEHDATLAARARECLANFSNVIVIEGDGATAPFGVADVIYVNAGVTYPADSWLDNLSDSGRLIIPFTTDANFTSFGRAGFDANPLKAVQSGAYFRILRRGTVFEARGLFPTIIIPAVGARDVTCEAALAAAFEKGPWDTVTRLVRGDAVPAGHCWLHAPGWALVCD